MLEAGELDLLAANEGAVAFCDGFPLNPGHALIIPRRHEGDLFALTAAERDAVFALLPAVRGAVQDRFGSPDGFNVGVNVGLAAGQTIGHVHVHLIPRHDGDVDYTGDGSRDPRGGVRWVVPQRADYWS